MKRPRRQQKQKRQELPPRKLDDVLGGAGDPNTDKYEPIDPDNT